LRHQGADRQGQPRGSLEGSREGAVGAGVRDPHVDLARQGNLLRRQNLRSRESRRVSEVPVHQARRSVIAAGRACCAARPFNHEDDAEMWLPAMKSEAAVAAPAASAPAEIVTMTPRRAPVTEKYVKMARDAAVRVIPPLVVLALLLLF